ncbi:ABC transporter permease [Verminephrobacter eiseniae]|uniref:Binding-protein-dependent transport systems inner membrane component n=1 Tax=Verminephrobacter eiseniae (strain EF01-2) TaxID=391735 RepID=A1WG09_VEREI|nr:ABC transporter permease [Verminephrobacter eiseniae]ABM56566.1 binding-protein-dependent transport systems inner membrane component [Verminephrobacter eiseniae EF01-2]
MLEIHKTSWPMRLLVLVLFAYLLAPVTLVLPLSFSGDQVLRFPPSFWSTRWYTALFGNAQMLKAFSTSLVLATIVTTVSIVVAAPAAWALARLDFRGKQLLLNLLTAPLLLPSIVLGLAILIVFAALGLLATMQGLVLAHLVLTLPYALRVLAVSLSTQDRACEEAARTLGAKPMVVFFRVTVPLMLPGIVAAAALCFLVSFDEVVISLFLTGPRITTLPVALYHYVYNQADPLVAAASVLLILLTLAVIMIVERALGLGRAFVR